MKNTLKRISALLMSMILVLTMCAGAWADGDPAPASTSKTITVTGIETGLGSGVTAYQIIKQNATTKEWEFNLNDTLKASIAKYEADVAAAAAGITVAVPDDVKAWQDLGLKVSDFTYDSDASADTIAATPTDAKLAAITTAINKGMIVNTSPVTLTESTTTEGTYSADVSSTAPGMYYVRVASGEYVYNPMVVSIQETGTEGSLTVGTGSDRAKAKAQEIGQTKTITNIGTSGNTTNKNGDAHQIGDDITFAIDATIPTYNSDVYKKVVYIVKDTISTGLSYVANDSNSASAKVQVSDYDGTTYTDLDTSKYSVTVSGQKLYVAFASSYILANPGQKIKVTYTAELNENAGANFDVNSNKVDITYTSEPVDSTTKQLTDTELTAIPDIPSDPTDPGKEYPTDKKPVTKTTDESKTYHYTFGIDTTVGGTGITAVDESSSSDDKTIDTTHEFVKVGEGGSTESIKNTTDKTGDTYTKDDTTVKPLGGAQFVLRKSGTSATKAGDDGYIDGGTTDDLGKLALEGMDASASEKDNIYELVETVPPTGYTLNSTITYVRVACKWNADGTLKDYTIYMKQGATGSWTATATYTATYEKITKTVDEKTGAVTYTDKDGNVVSADKINPEVETVVTVKRTDSNPLAFENTKLASLPSTGGIGTYVFTILGVVIMVVAAGLFFIRKKRQA